ncbi:hypothetical protein [Kribbella sp. CA-294648]|uniref:hypothetical protein n=1 Tax=Kribbella sp. CA-294648 TaxID=3239948 RepID=UPI003D8AD1BE
MTFELSDDGRVLRIYLDQNKWVDLARAATGHRLGAPFADALAMARAGVAAGTVSFPLDMYRYWETGKRGDDRSRNDVADVMLELSRQHTMTVPFGILDQELDLALQRRLGRPEHPRRQAVFGVGMQHITQSRMKWPELDLAALPDSGAGLPRGLRAQLKNAVAEVIEEELLRAGPETFRAHGFDHADSDHSQRFVDFENHLAAEIAKHGLTGDAIDEVVRGTDFGDIRPAIVEALDRIGVVYEEFMQDITVGQLLSFVDDLPTRYVTNVMRSAKHRQTQQEWEPNDFIDIVALPVAAVYCDVVVTEKQWVHMMRQSKVDQRYNTILISNVADLVNVLVKASLM